MQDKNIDYIVLSEGEERLPKLLKAIDADKGFEDIDGLCYRVDGEWRVQPHTGIGIEDLDTLPWPDYSDFDMSRYLNWTQRYTQNFQFQQLPVGLMMTSRGCPYKCTFCQVPVMFDGVRLRSPDSLVKELALYKEEYAVESMYFRDDILFRPEKLAKAFAEASLDLKWSCLLRADMMTKRTLEAMREGGCAQIRVGFESGDDAVLDEMKKQTTVNDNARCIHLAREAGIDISGFLIVGLPGETTICTARGVVVLEGSAGRGAGGGLKLED